MKKLVLIIACFITFCSVAQTLHTDDSGVHVYYEIKQTKEFTSCQRSGGFDKNYTSIKINIWKVTLGIENGSSGAIVPRGVGIANISVSPNPIKPYPSDYCRYKYLGNYGPNSGYLDQSLFDWPIREFVVEEIKPGEVLKNTAYLYLYEGQTPELANWQFQGYRSKEDFKPFDALASNKEKKEMEPLKEVDQKDTSVSTKAPEAIAAVQIEKDLITDPKPKLKEVVIVAQNKKDPIINTKPKVSPAYIKTNKKAKPLEIKPTVIEDSQKIPGPEIREKEVQTSDVASAGSTTIGEIPTTRKVEDTPAKVLSNCPGDKALEYKQKSNNSADVTEQRAYSWLAIYYTYKCECDTGSRRSDQLVNVINNIVDSYTANTNDAYGKILKVSKCKAPIK